MSVTLNGANGIPLQTEGAHEILSASLAKKQQTIEGQMVLSLIESSTVPTQSNVATSPTLGSHVNIAV